MIKEGYSLCYFGVKYDDILDYEVLLKNFTKVSNG